MRNKILLASLAAGTLAFAALFALTVTFFTIDSTPVQAEEAAIETMDAAPDYQVEPVVNTIEQEPATIDHAKYAGYEGGCSFKSAKQQMVEAPASEPVIAESELLTLVDAQ